MISFDELILVRLFELCLPGATIEPQFPHERRLVDFKITLGSETKLVEFFGPYHFIQRGRKAPVDPRFRKRVLEDATGFECVIWPYWAQRCESNVKALFSTANDGIGSIWSTSAHFGDFAFDDASELIVELNDRLRLGRPDGVGYFYGDEVVTKPVHPIVRRIRQGRENISKLIPPGSSLPNRYWLPRELWSQSEVV